MQCGGSSVHRKAITRFIEEFTLRLCSAYTWHDHSLWGVNHRLSTLRTGPNRGSSHWFGPKVRSVSMVQFDPGRSCLLPTKYKFSAEYCLPFCRLLLYVSKMSPKRLRMFVILLINQKISSSGKLHTIFGAKFGGYVVHGESTAQVSTSPNKRLLKTARISANQAFRWCVSPLSASHWVRTVWVWMSASRFWSRIECPFGPVRTMESQWLNFRSKSWSEVHPITTIDFPEIWAPSLCTRPHFKGVMTRSMVDTLSELWSPFLKGGNSAVIAAIAGDLFPQTEHRSLE